jgi:hypothetical protein
MNTARRGLAHRRPGNARQQGRGVNHYPPEAEPKASVNAEAHYQRGNQK